MTQITRTKLNVDTFVDIIAKASTNYLVFRKTEYLDQKMTFYEFFSDFLGYAVETAKVELKYNIKAH